MNLLAPPEYFALTPEAKADICNGCGPLGWKGMLVPDDLLGADITEPCNVHDYRYHCGGEEADRFVADREFLSNMLNVAESDSFDSALEEVRRELALRYYCAVRDHGRSYFSFRQQAA
ncbi:MAG TPA: hypothetical protein DCZ63_15260 [Geobacter sp.]|nr:hypothetical protein [Geobacter sp.]